MTGIEALATCLCIGTWPSTIHGGAWASGAGHWQVRGAASFWATDRKFASTLDVLSHFPGLGSVRLGQLVPFDPLSGAGDLRVFSLSTQLGYGLADWLDLGLALPGIWADFDSRPVDTVDARFGPGDLSLSAQAIVFEWRQLVGSTRVEWKLPVGAFDPSVYASPIAEGQMDLAAAAAVGYSLWPYGYLSGEIGRKFRFENASNGRRPGDEWLAVLEAGADLPRGFGLKLAVDGLWGEAGQFDRFGVRTPLPGRQAYSLWGEILWKATDKLAFELGDRYFLAGEDYPAGHQVFTAATQRF